MNTRITVLDRISVYFYFFLSYGHFPELPTQHSK